MKISLPELLEDDEFLLENPADRGVYGWIHDDEQTIARYFVYWTKGEPGRGVIFDLIVGPAAPLEPQANRFAISLIHHGLRSPSFIDARARPFAKRQALHCTFPIMGSHADDVAVNALNLVDFILKHDTRLVDCFGGAA